MPRGKVEKLIHDPDQYQNVVEYSSPEGLYLIKISSIFIRNSFSSYLMPKTHYLSMTEKWKNCSWIRIPINPKI